MMFTGLTVLCLTVALSASVWAAFDSSLDQHWELWKKTYNKEYHTEEEELSRRALWEKNLEQISRHNLEENLGLHSYSLGINHFSDLSKEEMLRLLVPLKLPEDFKMTPTPLRSRDLPNSVDWRLEGFVTKVKNQGSCGSCWAFSGVGALEGLWAKTTGKLVDLSPQNLVDCAGGKYGNLGCLGGWTHQAFDYIIANHGIDSEASYPYVAKDGSCHYSESGCAANCSSYHFVEKTESSLLQACASVGPISIGINADDIFQYKSGVFSSSTCGSVIDHGVLLVGYGTDESGLEYWLIKNSWGEGWGENGYIRLARNKHQMCGISLYSLYPSFDKNTNI